MENFGKEQPKKDLKCETNIQPDEAVVKGFGQKFFLKIVENHPAV